ncbi:MAG: acetamidase/formamidase family protein, partial [Gaiellales bacterium]
MKRIRRDEAHTYALDGRLEPVLRVEAGETFVIETDDASTGLLTAGDLLPVPENTPYTAYSPARANPVGGPVFVAGVRPRGRIRIEIVAIDLASHGVAYNQPPISPLGADSTFPEAGEYFIERVEHGETRAVISNRLSWPVWPMVGTLACAPEWEVRSTASGQGPWGGNVDVLDFRPGATVYLATYHEGGLLFAGDVHGCQSDTEYFGTAD